MLTWHATQGMTRHQVILGTLTLHVESYDHVYLTIIIIGTGTFAAVPRDTDMVLLVPDNVLYTGI